MRRIAASLTLLVALVAGLAACGDDSDDAGSATGADGEAGSGGGGDAYPVTIEHAYGSTTIEERPERIVSLNVQWTDAVLALGEQPVAYVLDAASSETDPYPWHADQVADIERIDMNGAIPYERLAELEPDLILTTWLVEDEGTYETLNGIAPTIGLLGDLDVDRWQDQVDVMGRVLGEPERAAAVIEEVEGQVTTVAEELPGLAGKTYVAANYVEGDGIYVVADPDDGASELFYELGLEIDPEILSVDEGAVGRVQLSLEQASLLDADLIGILANGSDPAELPGWDDLAAVRAGAVVEFSFADAVAMNTPTPLSVPHVLDLLRPALERAAA
jgi:iron complex transport system substrate-binding protein